MSLSKRINEAAYPIPSDLRIHDTYIGDRKINKGKTIYMLVSDSTEAARTRDKTEVAGWTAWRDDDGNLQGERSTITPSKFYTNRSDIRSTKLGKNDLAQLDKVIGDQIK